MEVKSAFSPVASTLGMPPDFRIEDLLDFSNDDFSSEDIAAPIGGDDAFQLPSLDSSTVTGKATATTGCCTNNNSNNNDQTHDIANTGTSTGPGVPLTGVKREAPLDEHPGDSLCVPCDDLDQLEWLSKFVEDSFSMGGETPRKGDGGIIEDYSVMGDHMPFESSYESSCKGFFQSTSPVSVLDSSSASSGGVLTAGGGGGGGGGLVNNGSNKAAAMGEKRSSGDEHSPQQQQNQSHLLRELSVPARARSKRSRTGGRVWGNSRILESPAAAASATSTDTESLSSDSNVEISGGSNNDEVPLQNSSCSSLSADSGHEFRQLQLQQHQLLLMMTPPPKAVTTVKKPWKPGKSGNSSKKLLLADAGGGADGGAPGATSAQTSWRCLHCATQRTPQWRAGPMGPKTLCNACGVRYKSGRLLPEYRPAGSPGYVGHKHSNSHKKILEMRRIKETSAPSSSPPPPAPAPAPAHTPAPSTVTSLLPAPYPYNATSSSGSGSLPVSGVESPTGGISPSLTS